MLNEALYGKAYFKEVTIVVPSHWEDTRCRMNVLEPAGEIAYQVFLSKPYIESCG